MSRTTGPIRYAHVVLFACIALIVALCGQPSAGQTVSLYTWSNVSIQGMGYVTGLLVRPDSPYDVYARTDIGGMYRYDRAAEKWLALMDGLEVTQTSSLDVESIAITPGATAPSRVYAAVYWHNGVSSDPAFYASSSEVLVSEDKGQTWSATGLAPHHVDIAPNGEYRTNTGERLAVDPNNNGTILFGTRRNGLWKGVRGAGSAYTWSQITSGLPTPSDLYDYYELQRDANNVWQIQRDQSNNPVGNPDPAGFTFVLWDPSSAGRVYVGVNGRGVYASTNSAASFALLAGSPTYPMRGAIAADGTLYVTSGTEGYGQLGTTGSINRTGSVWRLRSGTWANVTPGSQDSPYTGITAQRDDSAVVMVGRDSTVWRSTASGNLGTWSSQALNLKAPGSPSAPGYYTNDESGVSGGVAAMHIDPSSASMVWWTNGWGVARCDSIAAFPSANWTWRMNNLEELLAYDVEVSTKAKASDGADLLSAVADVIGFRHVSRNTVPASKINPSNLPLPSALTNNSSDAAQFNAQYQWMHNTWPSGYFPNPFPHVTSGTSIDSSYGAPDHAAMVGFHQFSTLWPMTGYSSDGGATWTAFASYPEQLDVYTSGGSTYTNRFRATAGQVCLGSAVLAGGNHPAMVWVPAAATFGNPWWNTTYMPFDSRIPWPHYSTNGGATWQVCRLASAADRPAISRVNSGSGGVWDQHVNDLPKGWGHWITPWVPSHVVAAAPSDPAGRTLYYYCNDGPYSGGMSWGIVYRSLDGGATWTKRDEGKFPGWQLKSQIVVNPTNASDVWMAFARNDHRIAGHPLFRSNSAGTSFAAVAGVASAEFIAFGKGRIGATPALYMLGRVTGASQNAFYRSDDLAATWVRISGYGYGTIRDLDADMRSFGVVYAAAGGRGVFAGTAPVATIASRLAFYNRSYFDGNDPAASTADDAAIATDKTALLPGQTAGFANYTSYSRGLNGLMLDIAAAPGTLAADDFAFRVGNTLDPSTWATGPAPLSVTRRAGAGAGGSDRYTLIFADNAIAKQWLQVTVLANADTGLAAPDVFYFGNAVGESGNSAANAMVNSTDELGARNNPHGLSNRATVTDAYDYNRDSLVNSTDQLIARNNGTGISTALRLITAP